MEALARHCDPVHSMDHDHHVIPNIYRLLYSRVYKQHHPNTFRRKLICIMARYEIFYVKGELE